ncbi:hypothetical protein DFJ73DRAFT_300476 [Zopfochytrium polystomum]|nr:hypothetical protein DFJ73DRAFT_300476 [Zopfochytrium polystomum]
MKTETKQNKIQVPMMAGGRPARHRRREQSFVVVFGRWFAVAAAAAAAAAAAVAGTGGAAEGRFVTLSSDRSSAPTPATAPAAASHSLSSCISTSSSSPLLASLSSTVVDSTRSETSSSAANSAASSLPSTSALFARFLPPFVICFREAIEGVIVVSLLLHFISHSLSPTPLLASDSFADKLLILRRRLQRHVWIGAITGLIGTLAVAVSVIAGVRGVAVWVNGQSGAWATFALEVFAVVFQTYLAVKFFKMARERRGVRRRSRPGPSPENPWHGDSGIHAEWQQSLDWHVQVEREDARKDIEVSRRFPFVGVAATVVFREGVETVVFLLGMTTRSDGAFSSLILPSLCGVLVAVGLGVVIHNRNRLSRKTDSLDLSRFFRVSALLMLILSASLLSSTVGEFQESLESSADFDQSLLWNLSECCDEETGPWIYQIAGALLGWRAKMSWVVAGLLLAYWVVVVWIVCGSSISSILSWARAIASPSRRVSTIPRWHRIIDAEAEMLRKE